MFIGLGTLMIIWGVQDLSLHPWMGFMEIAVGLIIQWLSVVPSKGK